MATVESRRHQCLNEEFPGNSALAIPHRYSGSLRELHVVMTFAAFGLFTAKGQSSPNFVHFF